MKTLFTLLSLSVLALASEVSLTVLGSGGPETTDRARLLVDTCSGVKKIVHSYRMRRTYGHEAAVRRRYHNTIVFAEDPMRFELAPETSNASKP